MNNPTAKIDDFCPKNPSTQRAKERKYNSVHLENLREILYVGLLNSWGYSFVFIRPKKFSIHTVLPFIHISKCIDPFGNTVFSYDQLRNEAVSLRVGEGKKDMERRITQYIKNRTNNILVDCIISMPFVIASEKKSTKAITVNTSTPCLKKLENVIVYDGANYWTISSKEENTVAFLDEIHKAIFDDTIKMNLVLSPLSVPISSIMQHTPFTNSSDDQSNYKTENTSFVSYD